MPKTIQELNKTGYVWRFKPIRFTGSSVPETPQRAGNYPDQFDMVFSSKEEFDTWYKSAVAGLAELDEAMNYCKYFVREKGNDGHYVRDGKSFQVKGNWIGIQDFDNYPPCQPFVKWLEENGWRNNWFELMDKYKSMV